MSATGSSTFPILPLPLPSLGELYNLNFWEPMVLFIARNGLLAHDCSWGSYVGLFMTGSTWGYSSPSCIEISIMLTGINV